MNSPDQNFEEDILIPKRHQSLKLDSRMEDVIQKYFVHMVIKKSSQTAHYIVEDQSHSKNYQDNIFYMKQMFFDDQKSYEESLDFYSRYLNYSYTPFRKNDILKLQHLYQLSFPEDNYFEIILLQEYGESDRIDIPKIESKHITLFLKNLCLLLEDIKKLQELYHGNIQIKSIILINNTLKLGGLKPLLSNEQLSWKKEIFHLYGKYRLDLFMVGILWIAFEGHETKQYYQGMSLEQIEQMIEKEDYQLPLIATKLLDLKNHRDITIEDVIATFQEDYILEHMVPAEGEWQKRGSLFDGFRGELNDNLHSAENESNNPFHPNSHTNSFLESQKEEKLQSFTNEYFKLDNFTLQDNQSEKKDSIPPQEVDFMTHLKHQSLSNTKDNNNARLSTKDQKEIHAILVSSSEKHIVKNLIPSFKNIIVNEVITEDLKDNQEVVSEQKIDEFLPFQKKTEAVVF